MGGGTAARSKDPKKVAAGRAGAAARRAKQQRLLDELRAAKATLEPSEVAATAAAPSTTAAPATAAATTTPTSFAMWIAAAIGLAGVVWMSAKPVANARGAGGEATTPAAGRQLKTNNPFHME